MKKKQFVYLNSTSCVDYLTQNSWARYHNMNGIASHQLERFVFESKVETLDFRRLYSLRILFIEDSDKYQNDRK